MNNLQRPRFMTRVTSSSPCFAILKTFANLRKSLKRPSVGRRLMMGSFVTGCAVVRASHSEPLTEFNNSSKRMIIRHGTVSNRMWFHLLKLYQVPEYRNFIQKRSRGDPFGFMITVKNILALSTQLMKNGKSPREHLMSYRMYSLLRLHFESSMPALVTALSSAISYEPLIRNFRPYRSLSPARKSVSKM